MENIEIGWYGAQRETKLTEKRGDKWGTPQRRATDIEKEVRGRKVVKVEAMLREQPLVNKTISTSLVVAMIQSSSTFGFKDCMLQRSIFGESVAPKNVDENPDYTPD